MTPNNDQFGILAPKCIDSRSMKVVSSASTPYTSVSEAHAAIAYKAMGVPVYVAIDGLPVEHQYVGGFSQSNLIPVVSSGYARMQTVSINDNYLLSNGSYNGTALVRQGTGFFSGIHFKNGGVDILIGASSTSGSTVAELKAISVSNLGQVTINDFIGSATRMVVTDEDGQLSTQAIPLSTPLYFSNQFTGDGTTTEDPIEINFQNLINDYYILRAPNASLWRVTVSNSGVLATVPHT